MNCKLTQIADGVSCQRCGRTLKTKVPPEKVHLICPVWSLGDFTQRQLARVGITKPRYLALKKRILRVPSPKCGCDKRQEWLNETGWKAQKWWRGIRWRIMYGKK